MKKLLIMMLLPLFLIGCQTVTTTVATTATTTTTTTTTETTTTQTTTTIISGVPNGLEPLEAVSDCDNPTLEGGWVCVWADEFNGDAVDETKWNFEVNGDGGGNQELQYYRRENATVSGGYLNITAKLESYLGKLYTSARLNTKYKGTFEYVRIDFRAKMPSGRGTWPAIWMMPLMNAYGGWPDSGEIDILEYVGYNPDVLYTTLHTEVFNGRLGTQLGYSKTIEAAETAYHDFSFIWSPGQIKTYVDDAKIAEFNYAPYFTRDYAYYQVFPFDSPFFLIVNLAVGGTWGGAEGVDPDIFPTTLSVDYIRVYRLDYATFDTENPSTPVDLEPANLANTIFWDAATDDYGVEKYAIYVDGVFRAYSSLNQYTLTGLDDGTTYNIQVQAVDFVGRTSGKSAMLSFTYHS